MKIRSRPLHPISKSFKTKYSQEEMPLKEARDCHCDRVAESMLDASVTTGTSVAATRDNDRDLESRVLLEI